MLCKKGIKLFNNKNIDTFSRIFVIATDHGLNDRGSIPGRSKISFSYSIASDRLWGPPILLSNG
jgi:hypothetical protein